MATVGENIRSRRLALRMTQEELAAVLIRLLMVSVLGNLYLWDQAEEEVTVSSDPARYADYIGGAALADYRDKLDMDEDIFPETINGAGMSAEAF